MITTATLIAFCLGGLVVCAMPKKVENHDELIHGLIETILTLEDVIKTYDPDAELPSTPVTIDRNEYNQD